VTVVVPIVTVVETNLKIMLKHLKRESNIIWVEKIVTVVVPIDIFTKKIWKNLFFLSVYFGVLGKFFSAEKERRQKKKKRKKNKREEKTRL